ncbi:MAG: transglycosylase SLT domain-containing protein [Albidovulum sp.]|uniref:transglycosylase SLT domain-containing protein n=1 Tax=Albidovulum sp. TaxID=1872424 RepID=UPI003CBCC138
MSNVQNAPYTGGILRGLCLVLVGLLIAVPVKASTEADLSVICDQVAAEASRRSGVPVSVLRAISLTETGRKRDGAFRPWPWTVNMEGKGVWFETEDEARAYVYKEYKRGARSFDVGCFQINYKWHGKAFRSIEEMFDPLANALYAARFLTELHAEMGSWGKAAGAYHSRTPEYANRYQARFERFQTKLAADPGSDIPEIPDIVRVANGGAETYADLSVPRVNHYPLLQTGTFAGLGSLVPLGNGGGASLFASTTPSSEVN